MQRLIEFRTWGGSVPYFVSNYMRGVVYDCKYVGVSHSDKTSFLPDTLRVLTADEFVEFVKNTVVVKEVVEGEAVLMTVDEKEVYARKWLANNYIEPEVGNE